MCTESGGVVDDLLVYRYSPEKFLLVVNAANVEKDWNWFSTHLPADGVIIENISMKTAEAALQGPAAETILAKVCTVDVRALKFFTFTDSVTVGGIPAIVSRTGYTGEDGFEIYVPWEKGPELWDLLLEAGKEHGILPIGLGARDSLRFEATPLAPLVHGYVGRLSGFLFRKMDNRRRHRAASTKRERGGLKRKFRELRLEARCAAVS